MNAAPAMPATMQLSALLHEYGELPATYDRELCGLQLDSRQVKPGDLFVACRGAAFDGRSFIADAIAGGAVAVLVEADEHWQAPSIERAVPLVPVADLPRRVSQLAARFYGCPAEHLRLIGITGTNGKTSCCHLIAHSLDALGARCGIIGTLGNVIPGAPIARDIHGPSTTPDAVRLQALLQQMLSHDSDTVVMEVSSHGLDQHRVNVDDFSVAVFTNLTRDHLDYHGSMEAYAEAKARLFHGKRLQLAILNHDDPFTARFVSVLPATARALTWSLHNPAASVHAVRRQFTATGITLEVSSPWGSGVINSRLFGSFNASNLLAVLATVLACEATAADFNAARILDVVSALPTVPGRMQVIDGYPVTVVIDYAHSPDGLEKALGALREHFSGTLACVFGCGGERDAGKRPLMAAIAARLADRIIVTDDNPRHEPSSQIISQILDGFDAGQAVQVEPDRAKAIALAIANAAPGSVVLIAGKGHEDYQETNGIRRPFNDVEQARLCLQQRWWGDVLQ